MIWHPISQSIVAAQIAVQVAVQVAAQGAIICREEEEESPEEDTPDWD